MERPQHRTPEQSEETQGLRNRIGKFVIGLGNRIMDEDGTPGTNDDQHLPGSTEKPSVSKIPSGSHDDLSQETSSMYDDQLTRADLLDEYQKIQVFYSDIDDLSGFGDVDLGSGIYAATSSPFVGDGVVGAQIKREFLNR